MAEFEERAESFHTSTALCVEPHSRGPRTHPFAAVYSLARQRRVESTESHLGHGTASKLWAPIRALMRRLQTKTESGAFRDGHVINRRQRNGTLRRETWRTERKFEKLCGYFSQHSS